MSNQFIERHEDDNTGTSQELTVTAIPKARLEVRIKMESPEGGAKAKYTLHRYRVRALVHMLNEWLETTKDQDTAQAGDGTSHPFPHARVTFQPPPFAVGEAYAKATLNETRGRTRK